MGELASEAGKKLVAVLILAVAAYVLFKLVLGVVAAVAWIIVAVLAVAAIVWAVRVL
jgi:hypothetical protein